ncbi:hypothetical protein [Apilactobacillus timberlakei]|uniref:hypothetical protein n=1 Tax=Apilactobacillus timberlakei TaxID=2008380 RepID=UPI0011282C8B|nr:hypothetical protein [Apilactobacillus timberlakei]TPR12269.1 hypothetical protein DYZ97_07255 [Apilactobacillus timberlakei]
MINFLAILLGIMIFAALIATLINQLMLRYFAYKRAYMMFLILSKEMSKTCTTEEIKEIISAQTGVNLNKSKENE